MILPFKPIQRASDEQPPLQHEIPLLVKDGIRQLRFAARQSARQLTNQLKKKGELSPGWAPPLGEVAQMAMDAMDGLDRLAVQLVSSASDYRAMNFRLLPAQQAAGTMVANGSPRDFDHNFYWVFKHLLRLDQRENVTVLEESVHHAGLLFGKHERQVQATRGGTVRGPIEAMLTANRVAALAHAFHIHSPLHFHELDQVSVGMKAEQAKEEAQGLARRLIYAAAIAGEVALCYPRATLPEEVLHALQMALRIADSRQNEFLTALHDPQAITSLTEEMAFVLRHI